VPIVIQREHNLMIAHGKKYLITCIQRRAQLKTVFVSIVSSLYNTKHEARNLHLYFVKYFGCRIVEGNIAIDLKPFSKALMEGCSHPNIYLSFGFIDDPAFQAVGATDIEAELLNGSCAFAIQEYYVGNFYVHVMYAEPEEKRQGLLNAWHPKFGSKRFAIEKIVDEED